jgi:hypothetical protein
MVSRNRLHTDHMGGLRPPQPLENRMHTTAGLTPTIRATRAANIAPKSVPPMVTFMRWVEPETGQHCVSFLEPHEVAASVDALLRDGIGFTVSATPV